MSQHTFDTAIADGRKVHVQTGYDRMLKGFHLQIEDLSEGVDPDDCYIYANHADVKLLPFMGYPKDLERFQDVFEEFGVELPKSLIDELISDQEDNVGNRMITYDEDGDAVEMNLRVERERA